LDFEIDWKLEIWILKFYFMPKIFLIKLFKNEAFVKYALTGAVVSLGELFLLYHLIEGGRWYYLWASTLTFGLGLLVSFFLRKLIVFKNHDWSQWPRQSFFYCLVWLIDLVLNAGFMFALVSVAGISYLLSQIISNCFLGIFGFLFNKLVTFKSLKITQIASQHHHLLEEIEGKILKD
jgi:putative flippase GtrA